MSTERPQTDDYEELRIEGLRALARVIVRHALANLEEEPERPETGAEAPAGEAPARGRRGGAP